MRSFSCGRTVVPRGERRGGLDVVGHDPDAAGAGRKAARRFDEGSDIVSAPSAPGFGLGVKREKVTVKAETVKRLPVRCSRRTFERKRDAGIQQVAEQPHIRVRISRQPDAEAQLQAVFVENAETAVQQQDQGVAVGRLPEHAFPVETEPDLGAPQFERTLAARPEKTGEFDPERRVLLRQQRGDFFTVRLIPVTRSDTALVERTPGSLVNLEGDVIGKYVRRQFELRSSRAPEPKSDITMDTLREAGFL